MPSKRRIAAGAVWAGFIGMVGAGLASAAAAAVLKRRLPDRARPEDDELDLVAIFDGRRLRSSSTAFRGGRILCWYAGTDVDLRGATLDPAGAELLVWIVFGGTRVRVPEHWRVRMHGVAIFGGAGSMAQAPDDADPGPVLNVRCRTVFGGFGIMPEPDDEVLAV